MNNKITIISSGLELPMNAKYFAYKLENAGENYEIISQEKNVYVSDNFIIKKKWRFFFYILKLWWFFKKILNFFKKENNDFKIIRQLFDIEENNFVNFRPKINFQKNINEYIQELKIDKWNIFISFWAPIIKNKTIEMVDMQWWFFLNSHIWSSNYPWITPYLWSLYNKDFLEVWFILHKITDRVDKWDIFLEKKIILKDLYSQIWLFNISILTYFLILYSADEIFKYLSSKENIIWEYDIVKRTYDSDIKINFVPTYFHNLIAERNLFKYLNK